MLAASAQTAIVELPRGFKNAGPVVLRESSIVVSIAMGDQVYLNDEPIEKQELANKIAKLLSREAEQDKIVFLACGADVEYGKVVEVLSVIRGQGVGQIALIVDRRSSGAILRGTFLIEVPLVRNPYEDISMLKPNPLTLLASLSSELRLRLNRELGPTRGQLCFGSVPHGLGSDPANLQKWLTCLFAGRTKQHAYKVGMETRTDVPLPQRIEKTVFVKAPRSIKYIDVLRVIDAVKGADANPIGLQIDDLPK